MDYTPFMEDIRQMCKMKRVDVSQKITPWAVMVIDKILNQIDEEVAWAKLYNRITINEVLKRNLKRKRLTTSVASKAQ